MPSYNFQNVLWSILEILIWKSLEILKLLPDTIGGVILLEIQLWGGGYMQGISGKLHMPVLISQFSYVTAGATAFHPLGLYVQQSLICDGSAQNVWTCGVCQGSVSLEVIMP